MVVRSLDFEVFLYEVVEKGRGWGGAYVNSILTGIVDAILAVRI